MTWSGPIALFRWCLVLLVLILGTAVAFAHAALIGSDPFDGAVLSKAPSRLALTFSEPVSPLVLRLVAADGTATVLDRYHLVGSVLIVDRPPDMHNGTHALS